MTTKPNTETERQGAPERIYIFDETDDTDRENNETSLTGPTAERWHNDQIEYIRHDAPELVRLRRIAEMARDARAITKQQVDATVFFNELDALLSAHSAAETLAAKPKTGDV